MITLVLAFRHSIENCSIVNYQNRGLCYLPKPKAEADNTDLGFDNSRYHTKTEFNNCFDYTFFKQANRSAIFATKV